MLRKTFQKFLPVGDDSLASQDSIGDLESSQLVCSESSALLHGKVRIVEATMEPSIVRTQKTVASIFFGSNSEMEHRLFLLGTKDLVATSTLWTLWFVGLVLQLLVLADVIPEVMAWGCLAMIPLPVLTLLLMCKDLIWKVLRELEFYIINLLQAIAIHHAWWHLPHIYGWWDTRCIAILCFIPSMWVACLMDAYPAKFRSGFELIFFSGATIVCLSWNALVIFKHYDISPLTNQLGDNLTLLLFYGRHIYMSLVNPKVFVIISSPVQTVREELWKDEHGNYIKEVGDVIVEAPRGTINWQGESNLEPKEKPHQSESPVPESWPNSRPPSGTTSPRGA